jgi:hypothetical protein
MGREAGAGVGILIRRLGICRMNPGFIPRVVMALLAFATGASLLRAAEQPIGFVLRVDGSDWLINGQPVKQAGGSVPAGATIDLSPKADFKSGKTWTLTIIRLDNQPMVLTCNSFETCKKVLPAHAPGSVTPASSLFRRVEDAVSRLLSLNPDRYVPAISRGGGASAQLLPDTVLSLEKGGVDVLEWFDKVPAGRYSLTFDYIGRGGESRKPEIVTFDWTPGPPGFLATPKLQPGLYAASLHHGPPDGRRASEDAWVLISTPDRFAARAATFREAAAEAGKWQEQDRRGAEIFRRAVLDDLASQPAAR